MEGKARVWGGGGGRQQPAPDTATSHTFLGSWLCVWTRLAEFTVSCCICARALSSERPKRSAGHAADFDCGWAWVGSHARQNIVGNPHMGGNAPSKAREASVISPLRGAVVECLLQQITPLIESIACPVRKVHCTSFCGYSWKLVETVSPTLGPLAACRDLGGITSDAC